jgi:hypothetical protein
MPQIRFSIEVDTNVDFCPSIRRLTGLTFVGCASMLWLGRNEACFLPALQCGPQTSCPEHRLDR